MTGTMRRSDHAEELYDRAVRMLVGPGTVQERVQSAIAELSTLHPQGMAGEIQQAHERLLRDAGSRDAIAALDHSAAARLAMQVVEVFVVVRTHHGT